MTFHEFMKKQTVIFTKIVVPLGAGYFLSYLFRNINGPLAPHLIDEFSQNAASLGLLTSIYFFAFAIAQVPLGIALDRYGPRRVQGLLLMVAAGGALLFAAAQTMTALLVGRLMIGLGTAGCLMSGVKAAKHWFSGGNLALINGILIMFGGLGALVASSPLILLIDDMGWRFTMEILAGIAILLAFITYLLVPEISQKTLLQNNNQTLFSPKKWKMYWHFLPMSALSFGGVAALQGLWVVPWLTDVHHQSMDNIGLILTAMAMGLIIGGPLLGVIAGRLEKRRLSLANFVMWLTISLILLEIMIALRAPLPDLLTWPLLAIFGAIPAVSYSVLAKEFSGYTIARANSFLNIGHTLAAFFIQWLFGVIVAMWQRVDGIYPIQAYQAAFFVICGLQIMAIIWYAGARLSKSIS